MVVSRARHTGSSLALAAALVAAAAGCASPDPKVWNLSQLHDDATRHRYTAALQSDTGYFIRHRLLGVLEGAGARLAEKEAEAVEDPAEACLENLIELEERVAGEGPPHPGAVEWLARIAVEDPSRLSRERAVLALGDLGARLAIGLPARLGADQKPAGPDELTPRVEALVRAVRGLVESETASGDELRAACDAIRALDLDIPAGRRALRAAAELARTRPASDARAQALRELVPHLSALCVRRALGSAVEDKDAFVRAAALRSIARASGPRGVDAVHFERLKKEPDGPPLRAIVEVLAQDGIPDAATAGAPIAHSREEWLVALYALALQHPEGEMRVAAMRALAALESTGPHSLREEDWHAWWTARAPAARPAGPAP